VAEVMNVVVWQFLYCSCAGLIPFQPQHCRDYLGIACGMIRMKDFGAGIQFEV